MVSRRGPGGPGPRRDDGRDQGDARRTCSSQTGRRPDPAGDRPRDGHDRARRSTATSTATRRSSARVCHDLLDELTVVARARLGTRCALDDPIGRLVATCRAFRRWSLDAPARVPAQLRDHRPAPGRPVRPRRRVPGPRSCASAPSSSTSSSRSGSGAVPGARRGEPASRPTRQQLRAFSAVRRRRAAAGCIDGLPRRAGCGSTAPSPSRSSGMLGFALDDAEPMFEAMLAEMARSLEPAPGG